MRKLKLMALVAIFILPILGGCETVVTVEQVGDDFVATQVLGLVSDRTSKFRRADMPKGSVFQIVDLKEKIVLEGTFGKVKVPRRIGEFCYDNICKILYPHSDVVAINGYRTFFVVVVAGAVIYTTVIAGSGGGSSSPVAAITGGGPPGPPGGPGGGI